MLTFRNWKTETVEGVLNDRVLHNGEVHEPRSVRNYKFTIRVFGLLSFCFRKFHIWLCCCPTVFPRSPRHSWDICYIMGPAFLFPVSVGVRCYQPSCHSCFQFATIFKFLAANIWVRLRKRMISARRQILMYNHSRCTSLVTKLNAMCTCFRTEPSCVRIVVNWRI